ncbi:hypothetical protein M405DRAFT_449933 [Rhizopogon salebrosus TDB-379]|nr:hypothetical protein M405DRAFT_449933 [Rhizopogon salebrosus TDB-379]
MPALSHLICGTFLAGDQVLGELFCVDKSASFTSSLHRLRLQCELFRRVRFAVPATLVPGNVDIVVSKRCLHYVSKR